MYVFELGKIPAVAIRELLLCNYRTNRFFVFVSLQHNFHSLENFDLTSNLLAFRRIGIGIDITHQDGVVEDLKDLTVLQQPAPTRPPPHIQLP